MKRYLNLKIFIILINFIAVIAYANGQHVANKVEISKFDITKIRGFRADMVSVYGVYLGMKMTTAKRYLLNNDEIIMATNTNEPLSIKIYDRNAQGKMNKLLANLIWESASGGLKEIKVLEGFAPHLKGNTKRLLTLEAINTNSYISKAFLGKPDLVKRNKFTFINLVSTKYFFNKKGLIVECADVDGKKSVTFTLKD